MAVETQVLHADIVAEDHATAELRKVKAELDEMKRSSGMLSHELHETGISFAFLAERTEVFRDHFGELGRSIGETTASFGELAPALEVFGAAASVAGLLDLTREAAEARTQLAAMATTIGVTVPELEGLRLAARETDVPIDSMQTGFVRLQRAMTDAAGGKNKEVAEIFARMGISLRDAHGHLRNVGDVVPLVSESLRRTEDTTLRNAVAMKLFGRAGAELIPFLNLGRDGLDRIAAVSERLSAHFSSEDTENVEAYKNSWIELDASFQGLKDTITADLAPVLTPIVDSIRDWAAANRDWLGSSIRHDVEELRDDVAEIDFKAILADLHAVKDATTWVADLAGGWHRVFEAMVLIAGVRLLWGLSAPIRQLTTVTLEAGRLAYRLNHDVAGAWRNVGSAAAEAGAAEEVAANVGGHGLPRRAGLAGAAAREGEEAAEGALKGAASKTFLRGLVAEGLASAGGFALEGAAGLAGLALGGGEIAALGGIVYGLLHLPHWLDDLVHSINGPSVPNGVTNSRGLGNHVADPRHAGGGNVRGHHEYSIADDVRAQMPTPEQLGFIDAPIFNISLPPLKIGREPREPAKQIEIDQDHDQTVDPGESGDAEVRRAEPGAATLNIVFANAPEGLTATLQTTGTLKAGTIDYGTNKPAGGF